MRAYIKYCSRFATLWILCDYVNTHLPRAAGSPRFTTTDMIALMAIGMALGLLARGFVRLVAERPEEDLETIELTQAENAAEPPERSGRDWRSRPSQPSDPQA